MDVHRSTPSWNSSETEEDFRNPPLWDGPLARSFHRFMICLSLVIIFAIAGSFFFLKSNRHIHVNLTPGAAWTLFVIGGCLGVIWIINIYQRRY